MNYLQKLEIILIPPEEAMETGSVEEWANVLKEVKGLPTDYVDFVNKYGTGSINDFIWVLNPFSLNPYLNVLNRLPVILSAFSIDYQQEVLSKYSFYPSIYGLIPLAITDNGDYIFYSKNEANQAERIVIINGRSDDKIEFSMGFTEFFLKLCSNQIKQDIFPFDVLVDGCTFQKYSN